MLALGWPLRLSRCIELEAPLTKGLAAIRAGCQVARRAELNGVGSPRIKADGSPATLADFAVQAVVARILGEPFVGEERPVDLTDEMAVVVADLLRPDWSEVTADAVRDSVARGSQAPDSAGFWTLDPIDGTKGFLRGGQYCVALAWIRDGWPRVGILGCPRLSTEGTLFYATDQGGAFEDGHPLPLQRTAQRATLLFCESVEPGHSDRTRHRQIAQTVAPGQADSLAMDSQCKYGVVARDQADAYLRLPRDPSYEEKIWDHAAGALIATEAGCVVTDAAGRTLDFSTGCTLTKNRGIVVAPAALHQRLLSAIE